MRTLPKRLIAFTLAGLLGAAPIAGASPVKITAAEQRDVMLTVYNGNLGLVKDVREVRLDAGQIETHFMDVAAQIDATSVLLRSLTDPAGLKILEQNYEYDLLSSEKLMEKHVGRKVRLYQSNGTFQEATLLSTRGPVYDINGQIHMGHFGSVVLPALPENLVSKPTLAWLLRNTRPAPQRVEASYLTAGISWKSDYVMLINAADSRADLTGWVTINNQSGTTYRNAALKLVAGDINRATSRDDSRRAMELAAKAASPAVADREFKSEGFFEYHLYTLDGRTTIKESQTKQLTLLSAADFPVDKHFIYYGAASYHRTQYGVPISNQKVGVYLDIRNTKENRLGVPLPKGKVRVYKADASGSQQLIGEDWIDHTPKDERVRIKMGEAFDLVGERVQKDWKKIGGNLYEIEWEITLRNHKKEAVTVEVIEPMPGDWEVLRATHPHEKLQAFTARWKIPVPKEGATTLGYRTRVRF
ncbi:MAG TPA: DUF4139 domain-containing protein [Methylomirabilota bacterium]|nr:DUF4139 domain-containing protein [Methylomirabilota bacterium]